ncbi:MAG: ion channel [Myxococcota bacterium]
MTLAPNDSRIPEVRVQTSRGVVIRRGLEAHPFADAYHYLLTAPWPRFIFIMAALYVVANMVFATLYVVTGSHIENARQGNLVDAFFFSVQTMATIGYGYMAPVGFAANVLVAVEAVVGMVGLALMTGLAFAKFSRSTARVLFSKVAVIHPRDGVPCLMLRMANERTSQIVEAQARVVLARDEVTQEGDRMRRFHELKLSRSHTHLFALTWTAIHPITPDSPLYGLTRESMAAVSGELVASLVGTDEGSGQTVHALYSYFPDDIRWDTRFVDVLSTRSDGARVVDYTRFHETEPFRAAEGWNSNRV